jgi:hypothetical protein
LSAFTIGGTEQRIIMKTNAERHTPAINNDDLPLFISIW